MFICFMDGKMILMIIIGIIGIIFLGSICVVVTIRPLCSELGKTRN